MRRKTKCVIIVAVVVLLAATWTWRYVALNRLFKENYLSYPAEYAMGEEVKYGENRIFYGCCSVGYSITVQNRELLSFEKYAEKYGFAPTAYEERFGPGTTPDAVVEVTAVISNVDDTSGESFVSLRDFKIHGVSWDFPIDDTLFLNSNPNWDPTVLDLYLEEGEEVTVRLPFSMNMDVMPERMKNHIDTTDMWLLVTLYPVNINVRLSS